MQIRGLAIAGTAAALVIGLAGCGPKTDATNGSAPAGGSSAVATTAPAAPADPQSEFESAVSSLGDTPVKLDMTLVGGIKMSGAIDAKNLKADLTTDMGQLGSMQIRQVGTDMYVKAGGQLGTAVGGSSGKWMHVDTAKVKDGSPLNVKNNDPKATAKMLAASTDVAKTGEHAFKGVVDLTKSPTFNSSAAKGVAAKMKAVPFTAETDDQGRLTTLVFDLEQVAAGAGKMTTKYSDFGTPVDVKAPPASDVVPMPAKFRSAMGA